MATKFTHQTHGAKLSGSETVASLINKHKKNTASSVAEYVKYLESLSLDELHRHSITAGEIPIDNKDKLLTRLEKRFAKTLSKESTAKTAPKEFTVVE